MDTPSPGDIKLGRELNRKYPGRHIFMPCEQCGKPRWVQLAKGHIPKGRICRSCTASNMWGRGEENGNWQGGRIKDRHGYILVWVPKDSFFFPMSVQKYIPEHRLIMAQHLGRLLQPSEIVHHKNGNKEDNRIENLEIATRGGHSLDHSKGYKDGFRKGLADGKNAQIVMLKNKIIKLEKELGKK
jgi:hypothetical protein